MTRDRTDAATTTKNIDAVISQRRPMFIAKLKVACGQRLQIRINLTIIREWYVAASMAAGSLERKFDPARSEELWKKYDVTS
jgi:hypothetical protein